MIYPSGRYNLNFDICAIIMCSFLVLYLLIFKSLRIRRTRSYFWIVLCMLLCSSGELAMDIVRNKNGITFTNTQAEFATFVSHVSHNSIPFLLTLYFLSLTGLWHDMKRKNIIAISFPEIILIVTHIIPPIRHLIYYYHGDCLYTRGPLYILYYFIAIFYFLYYVSLLIRKRASIQKPNMIYGIVLCAGYVFGMAVGMINPYIRMTNFIQTLILTSAFFLLENDSSYLDKVTGVYNARRLVEDTYPLFHSSQSTYILSIKLQDLNDYRLMVGMSAMTEVLHQIGAWMLSLTNEETNFFRVGNGEFALLLYNADKDKTADIARTIRERFKESWSYSDDGSITIPAQIWVSSIPDRISTEEQVLSFSESSFNTDLPQNQIYVADEMKEEGRQTKVNVAIRRALTNDTFEVYYQPICDTSSGKIHSCEALVRMTDPELGPVSPEEFIKVAERTGTVSRIGSIVFEKVCQFISSKNPKQYGIDFIEVNLSPIQCMDQNLPSEFRNIMHKYHVNPEQIVLEITESAVIHNKGKVNNVIQELKNCGLLFALDDFGTGQANYSYIREFPFSIIKIDKSFLWAADKDPADRAVLKNMLSLVKDLNLKSVVEGVETEEQKNMLIKDGVNYLQGYLYSKPVSENLFIEYLKKFNGAE